MVDVPATGEGERDGAGAGRDAEVDDVTLRLLAKRGSHAQRNASHPSHPSHPSSASNASNASNASPVQNAIALSAIREVLSAHERAAVSHPTVLADPASYAEFLGAGLGLVIRAWEDSVRSTTKSKSE